jgi:hypothetical protein
MPDQSQLSPHDTAQQPKDVPFTRAFWESELARTKAGAEHGTIGRNIAGHDAWIKAGEAVFESYRKRMNITPQTRVADFGCGTLRVGVHFIRWLDAGCYWGLEPASGMTDLGKEMVGDEVLRDKRPQLTGTSPDALRQAAAFAPDLVISRAVATHIPPQEIETYTRSLVALTGKPGAQLTFDARVAAEPMTVPVERQDGGDYSMWAYLDLLRPLSLRKFIAADDKYNPHGQTATFELRCP